MTGAKAIKTKMSTLRNPQNKSSQTDDEVASTFGRRGAGSCVITGPSNTRLKKISTPESMQAVLLEGLLMPYRGEILSWVTLIAIFTELCPSTRGVWGLGFGVWGLGFG